MKNSVATFRALLWNLIHVLIEGRTDFPFWGTNRLPFLRDRQVALFEGQTGCLYWGTDRLPLLRDRQVALFEGQTVPYYFSLVLSHWTCHGMISENTNLYKLSTLNVGRVSARYGLLVHNVKKKCNVLKGKKANEWIFILPSKTCLVMKIRIYCDTKKCVPRRGWLEWVGFEKMLCG